MDSEVRRQRCLLAFGVLGALTLGGTAPVTADETPIIAELLASPEQFAGKRVVVYGVVVGVMGPAFALQDVSQAPLRVVGAAGAGVRVGDQVLVRGVFRLEGAQRYVSAEDIEAVQVAGGCGC
jgi:hypothetical protein